MLTPAVPTHTPRVGEPVATEVTYKGLLACMRSDMALEVALPLPEEGFPTDGTLVHSARCDDAGDPGRLLADHLQRAERGCPSSETGQSATWDSQGAQHGVKLD